MAVPASTRQVVRFEPDDSGVVYILGVPSVIDRSEVESAVIARGIRPVTAAQCRRTLRSAIERELSEPGEFLEALDRMKSAEEVDVADVELVQEAEVLVAGDERYARLVAMQVRWGPALRWEAARRLLRGWEGLDLEYRSVQGCVPDELLQQLPHQDEVCRRAYELLTLGDAEKKDSASPSPSD